MEEHLSHQHAWPGSQPQDRQTVSRPGPTSATEQTLHSSSPAVTHRLRCVDVVGKTACRLILPYPLQPKPYSIVWVRELMRDATSVFLVGHTQSGLRCYHQRNTKSLIESGREGYLSSSPNVLLLEPVQWLCEAGVHALREVGVGVAEVLADPLCNVLTTSHDLGL